MRDVLGFLHEMAIFYDKYHILPPETRAAFDKDMCDLTKRMSQATMVADSHVVSLQKRLNRLSANFEAWVHQPLNESKHWNLHPSDDLQLFLSKGKIIVSRMEHEVLSHRICAAGH